MSEALAGTRIFCACRAPANRTAGNSTTSFCVLRCTRRAGHQGACENNKLTAMSLDLFIAAAGTEIGKTYVAEQLIRECGIRGISCEALKPIVSGFDDSPQTDTARLLSALERTDQ